MTDRSERFAKLRERLDLGDRGREPKVDAYEKALIEIRDRCARVSDARSIADKVLKNHAD